MKRRTILKSIIAAPALAAAQTATPAPKDLTPGPPLIPPGINETPNTPVVPADETSDSVSRTFTAEQLSALAKLGEIIVPPWNGRPGASEANAAEFLEFLIGCSPQDRRELYRTGLNTLSSRAQQSFGKNFAGLSKEQAESILSPLKQSWVFENNDPFSRFLAAAKGDLLQATLNSRPYIDALSQTRRPRNASRYYWYPIS